MIGTQDLMVGLVIVLFFFGAKKLPRLGRLHREIDEGVQEGHRWGRRGGRIGRTNNRGCCDRRNSLAVCILSDSVAARLAVSETQRNGTIDNITTGQRNNNLDNTGVRAQLLWRASGSLDLTLAGDYNHQNARCCATVFVGYVPTQKYDLIVSVSTLEHVGWDEQPQEPAKLLQAIDHLRTACLAPSGTIVASLPIGYNGYFDALLASGKTPFTTQHFLKRISKKNYWIETDWESCRDASYGRFVANALCIGTINS
jgi:hypothetical protein